MELSHSKIPPSQFTSQIIQNIQFIRDLSIKYYKENNINFEDTPSDIKTSLNSLYPKVSKRRPSAIDRSCRKSLNPFIT